MLKQYVYQGEIKEIICELESRKETVNQEVMKKVLQMIETVKKEKDDALMEYAKKFDGFEMKNCAEMIVTKEEIEEGSEQIGEDMIRILERAKKQIIEFHRNQIQKSWYMDKQDGVILGQIVRPLKRVGIYVPGGTASYPSTVLMNAIPAKLAGVKEIVMFTPVKADGKIAPAILAAAKVCGIDTIYKIGGAQAIAAAAYGTEMIPKVDKIIGPGNIYVATAKKCCYGVVDIDMIAGPSEVLVIGDETANPRYVAADLMSQAEHDKLASAIFITTSKELAKKVEEEIQKQIQKLNRKEIIESSLKNYGAIIVTNSLEEAFKIANEIAPEHLEILTKDPIRNLPKVENAGSIFLGENSPEPLGDYMSGTNHVLPTGGTAKFYSSLGVYDFVKFSSYSYYPKEVLETFKEDVKAFANLEGLDAHANSIQVRFEEKE